MFITSDRFTINWDMRSSFFLFLLGSGLLLHFHSLFLPGQLLFLKEFLPLLIQLLFLSLYVQLNSLWSQFLSLFIQEQNSWNIFLSSHSLPLNELHISLIIMLLLVLNQFVLDSNYILQTHFRVVLDIQPTLKYLFTK